MSELNLASLAEFAVANNNTSRGNGVPIYELSIEEARGKVKVVDGNKKAAEDGSVALVLRFGKSVLKLDAVAPNATRINANKDQVEQFTKVLTDAVTSGAFDEAIVAAQEAAKNPKPRKKPAAEKPSVFNAENGEQPAEDGAAEASAETAETTAPGGVDLDALG